VELVDLGTLSVRTTIAYPRSTPQGLAFDPTSRTLAVSAWSAGEERSDLRLWDPATGEPIGEPLVGLEDRDVVWTLEFSPDGRTLAAGARVLGPERGRVYLFDPVTGELRSRLPTEQPVNDLAYAPDGSLLAAPTGFANGGDTVLWHAETGRVARVVHTDDAAAYGAEFSSDGRLFLAAGQSSSVRPFSTTTGQAVGPAMTGLSGSADTADLSPDGRTVVGADSAGTAILWDAATGTVLGQPLPGPAPGSLLAAAFTPGGGRVVVMADSGQGWVWDVDPTGWAARACEVAGRSLTPQEWRDLLPDRAYRATCPA
jgi:WD40 repeat protein